MAAAAAKVIVCLAWLLSINGGYAQELLNPISNRPSDSSVYNREFTNGDDAIEMGRTAAEDMGALMASPPINLIRLNQEHPRTDSDKRHFIGQNNLYPPFVQARDSGGVRDLQYECVQYVDGFPETVKQGRSADGRAVNPMSLPLIPMLPSTSSLGRLPAIPPLATPIILALLPALNLRRRRLPIPPRLRPPPAPPLRLPALGSALRRSGFSPNNFYQQYRPIHLTY